MEISKKKLNKNLILLLLGRGVSDIGASIQMIVMPLFIIDMGGSAATVGFYSFLSLATVLVYPFAGVLGDRWNRKTIMVPQPVFRPDGYRFAPYLAVFDRSRKKQSNRKMSDFVFLAACLQVVLAHPPGSLSLSGSVS